MRYVSEVFKKKDIPFEKSILNKGSFFFRGRPISITHITN